MGRHPTRCRRLSSGPIRWRGYWRGERFRQWLTFATQRRVYRGGHAWREVAERPGLILWVVRIEIGDKFRVRQMPQARAIIRHPIRLPRDVKETLLVSVPTLVHR